MKRREFITLLGGAAAAWPWAVRAQQPERIRLLGVLMNLAGDDREGRARLAAFQDGLLQLGWIEGRNVRLDIRWGAGDAERFRAYSSELVALAPDLILLHPVPQCRPYCGQPAACRSYSYKLPIQSVTVTSQAGTARRKRHRLY